jgi:hypothetical protein
VSGSKVKLGRMNLRMLDMESAPFANAVEA